MSSDPTNKSAKVAAVAFGEALGLSRRKQTGTPPLKDATIDKLISDFEDAAHVDEHGVEFWYARDLQTLLGYTDYRNFINTVDKAKVACENSGQAVENHFVDVTEMVSIGSGASRPVDNIKLTRYACYLIAQNGDARKKPIAFAQTYFAIQTRRQEVTDDNEVQSVQLSEDEKRLLLREEIKTHNKNLASAAKGAGVREPIDFAIFQTFGYRGLYGGLDRPGIQRRKGLRSKQDLLDHMGSTELAANLFRATQTEDKLQRENIKGKEAANAAHYEVGSKVRQAIKDIGGAMPETLPAAEDIKKVSRRIKKAAKQLSK